MKTHKLLRLLRRPSLGWVERDRVGRFAYEGRFSLIKILHTADLHLDSPLRSLALKDDRLREQVQMASRSALERMVQFAIDEDVAAFLIAGDLFDGQERSAKTAAYLAGQLDRLGAAGVEVFYIKGNHDAENPVTGEVSLPANVHSFDGRGGKVQITGQDIWVHGVSFRDKHAPESLLPKFDAPVAGAVNIAMLHSSLTGAAGHDPYAPCSVAELSAMGFDYWALGHVHKRQIHSVAPFIVMPGMPQGRDIGEAGPKSATLISIDQGKIEIQDVPTSIVEFRESVLDISGADEDELRRALKAHLDVEAAATKSEAVILRLTLRGPSARAWQIRRDRDVWIETAQEFAMATGRVWIEKLRMEIEAPSVAGALDAVSELGKLMSEIGEDEGFRAAARSEVEQMIGLLSADRRREIAPDEDSFEALITTISEEAILSMIAKMKGVVS
jgi:DNA repair exonuclease SbcCD nuclease subunit